MGVNLLALVLLAVSLASPCPSPSLCFPIKGLQTQILSGCGKKGGESSSGNTQLGRDRPPAAAEGSDGRGQGVEACPQGFVLPCLKLSSPTPPLAPYKPTRPSTLLKLLSRCFPVTQAHKPLLALVLLGPSGAGGRRCCSLCQLA